jgi:hypothetical protein
MQGGPAQTTIAPLWDDWTGPAGQVPTAAQVLTRFIDFDGDGHPEYLIVDWKSVSNNGATVSAANSATFEEILQLNTGAAPGQIYFNYADTDVGVAGLNNGSSATVGIKDVNPAGARVLNVSVNTANADVASGHALGIFPLSSASATATIRVNNVAPELSAKPDDNLMPNEGSTFARTINVTDPGALDSFTGTVDFGDGSAVQSLGTLPAGTTSFQISHIYGNDRPANYVVTVNLTDKDGAPASPLTFTVTVKSVAPTLTVSGSHAVEPGQTITLNGQGTNAFVAKFTDPGFTVPGAPKSFTTSIDWGDGTVDAAPPNSAQATQTVTLGSPGVPTTGTIAGSHVYSARGAYTVTVTVTDENGNSDVKSFLIGVGAPHLYVAAADAGGTPMVRVFDTATRQEYLDLMAYSPRFSGGVRVAVGDIAGDGLPDVVTAAGPGGGPEVKVFDTATGALVRDFFAYAPTFTGGVYVAVGDVNGDGHADIITGADAGGGPHVKVFSGVDGSLLASFYAYDPSFHGGVRVAAADINNDGFADIITGAGAGGGPHVKVFSGKTGAVLQSFYAYQPTFSGGVYVAAGDINNNGQMDIITGPGIGAGPHLVIYDGANPGVVLKDTMAYSAGAPTVNNQQFVANSLWQSGLRVASTDINGDGYFDLVVAPAAGESPWFRILDGKSFADLTPAGQTSMLPLGFLGGEFVAGD